MTEAEKLQDAIQTLDRVLEHISVWEWAKSDNVFDELKRLRKRLVRTGHEYGYYWVRARWNWTEDDRLGDWEIAYYGEAKSGGEGIGWSTMGDESQRYDEPEIIGPILEPPPME
jgi:hypothetical protein